MIRSFRNFYQSIVAGMLAAGAALAWRPTGPNVRGNRELVPPTSKGAYVAAVPDPGNSVGCSGGMPLNLNIPRRRLLNRRRIAKLQGLQIRSSKARARAQKRMLARALAERKANA